jgi:hypothetical protein
VNTNKTPEHCSKKKLFFICIQTCLSHNLVQIGISLIQIRFRVSRNRSDFEQAFWISIDAQFLPSKRWNWKIIIKYKIVSLLISFPTSPILPPYNIIIKKIWPFYYDWFAHKLAPASLSHTLLITIAPASLLALLYQAIF